MKVVFFVFISLISFQLYASNQCSNCTIKHLGFGSHYDDLCQSTSCVFVMVDQNVSGRPACSTRAWHFTIDTTTDSGKGTLSALLAAHSTKSPVNIKGSGSCSNYTGAEDLRYVYY